MSLVATLGDTSPQYVRCIKPNSEKSAFLFEEELVLAQLRYSGMLETIRIRKAGYSVRVPYEQFLEKFKMLLPNLEGKIFIYLFFYFISFLLSQFFFSF